jgi:predicted amidophosphoribosyltransferase
MKRLEPEKPGDVLCQGCGRKLTQDSLSCVRCAKKVKLYLFCALF